MNLTLPGIVMTLATLAMGPQVNAAISIALQPSSQTVATGNPVSLDLVISGLGAGAAPSLGGFDVDLTYDTAVLSALSVAFSSHLDLGTAGSAQFADLSNGGAIHLDEVSFETASDLNAAQPSQFTLATLTFTTVGPGTGAVGYSQASFSDELGQSISGVSLTGASVTATGGSRVPDSGPSGALLLLGLASLMAFRRELRPA